MQSMLVLLGATLFLSAFLLFWCEPMVGKMMLPILGGAASVWTACMLFFQSMLLVGYACAHQLGKIKRLPTQMMIQASVLLVGCAFLPIGFHVSGQPSESPVAWLLIHLGLSLGVPFIAISATAPLVQKWLSTIPAAAGRDPYFLYAASNAGSLLGLMAYPIAVEPRYGVTAQSALWLRGYALLITVVGLSAVCIWREAQYSKGPDSAVDDHSACSPSWRTRAYWLTAAFVPTALMLAVTNHISFNIGSLPLLWVIPLAIYLLTFVMAFARTIRIPTATISSFATLVLVGFFPIVAAGESIQPAAVWKLVACHIGILFSAALLCHSALADRRPATKYLTQFYFIVAFGGALGGIFAAVLAPAMFKTVFEYPLLIALVPFFRHLGERDTPMRWRDAIDLTLFGSFVALVLYGLLDWARVDVTGFSLSWKDLTSHDNLAILAVQSAVILAMLFFWRRLLAFGIAFAVIVMVYSLILPHQFQSWPTVFAARNFFGVKRVLLDRNENMIRLLHGDTIHGVESLEPELAGQPLGYYHKTGPLGDVMEMLVGRGRQHIGVVGLGAGTIAAYGGSLRHVTFFEIDPQVLDIARDYFSFIRRCGGDCDVVIGDGRLQIQSQREREFDLLVLDAFNSDSVPAHLISREAVRTYLSQLKPNGVLLFHVPNRYLDIEKLVTSVVRAEGLQALIREDYIAAVPEADELIDIPNRDSWKPVDKAVGIQPWTDDYSNLLSLLRWQ
jgi:SAM-dependent methyltransferase